MLIKSADDRTADLQTLQSLLDRPDASGDTRARIEQELRNLQSGLRGERDAAYEVDFHYAQSSNWMVLHDLRLECEGRVAQIDHLLINRVLECYVCESKRFFEGVAINEHGEFAAFYHGKSRGMPSPLEQNRRHIAVLESVFSTEQVPLPRRLGLALKPKMFSLVLVSKNARIQRPKTEVPGIEEVLKCDQLKARIEKNISDDNNFLGLAKLIAPGTLEKLARALAQQHRPIQTTWTAKFGLPATPPPVAPAPTRAHEPGKEEGEKVSKRVCSRCGVPVSYSVAKFCWFNKPRFGSQIYCMDCQKEFPQAR